MCIFFRPSFKLIKYDCKTSFFFTAEQVFNQHDRSQLHHHFLHHLFHSAAWTYIFLLWKATAEAQEGQYEFNLFNEYSSVLDITL